MKIFSSVSSLKAATLTANQLVETKRYYDGIDGGQARYLIKTAADYGATPDEYGDHTLANGNVAVLQYEGAVNVKWFGAKGDGVTDDTASIQAANNFVALDTGEVLFPTGVYSITTTLFIDIGVSWIGQGQVSTTLKLADSSNVTMLESRSFDTLSGTNAWFFDTEDVKYRFQILNLQLDGNKVNQSSGDGIKLFGKGYFVDKVLVRDVKGIGFYSEAGDQAGQNGWEDLPEAYIDRLTVRSCDSNNIVIRGPHDHRINSMVSALSGADGVSIESSSGVYTGSGNFGFIHSYGNVGNGILIEAGISAEHLIGETNGKNGIIFGSASGRSQVNKIDVFNNDSADTGTWRELDITSSENIIDSLRSRSLSTNLLSSGVRVTGSNTIISSLLVDGRGNSGIGLELDADNITVSSGRVLGFSSSGGKGLKTNTTARTGLNITIHTDNNDTHWNNVNAGKRNIYNLDILSDTGEVGFTGASPATDESELWNVWITSSGVTTKSFNKGQAVISAASSSVVVTHGLILQPQAQDIMVRPSQNMTPASQFWVGSVGATTFTINTGAGVTNNTYFAWSAHL